MKKYKNSEDFRKSLEQTIRNISSQLNQDLERVRRKVAFERFLARLFHDNNSPWLLKGGFAMELRFNIARATKDIDLMVIDIQKFSNDNKIDHLLESLRNDSSINLNDYFEFFVNEATKELELPFYGGARFLVESLIGGRRFVKFNIDVGLGDISIQPIENRKSDGLLKNFGFDPIQYKLVNIEQQFAEKIHAYTLPRDHENSRAKDIVDLFLIIESNLLDKKLLSKSIKSVFDRRKSHIIPRELEEFPKNWDAVLKNLANSCDIQKNIDEIYRILNDYYKSIVEEFII
jgi:hypothetical protein